MTCFDQSNSSYMVAAAEAEDLSYRDLEAHMLQVCVLTWSFNIHLPCLHATQAAHA